MMQIVSYPKKHGELVGFLQEMAEKGGEIMAVVPTRIEQSAPAVLPKFNVIEYDVFVKHSSEG